MAEETGTPNGAGPEVAPNPSAPPTPRRGPGRPRKDGSTPPLAETSLNGSGARKSGSQKKAPEIDAGLLAKQLQGIHKMAAMMTGLTVLELQDREAEMLGESLANVAREYDLSIDGKTGATIQLLGVAAMIYVPRVLMIKQMKAQALQAARQAHENVDTAVN